MEPSKFGVENLKKVVALGIEIGNVADKFGKAEGTANKISTLMALTDEVLAIPGVATGLSGTKLAGIAIFL